MRVLVIGSGGREHALCWKIAQSPELSHLFCAPGNAGIKSVAECVSLDINTPQAVIDFCDQQTIDFVIIGPEAPLVDGLADRLRAHGIDCFGPGEEGAQLEGSKAFSKEICEACGVPTAAYGRFEDADSAIAYIREKGAPIVVKADGLAAGKGVTVAETEEEAIIAVQDALCGKFGEAGEVVVVEEYLEGEEVSFFALIDGETAVELGSAQDHKAVGEGDTGPNTGGMGTYSPAPLATPAFRKQVMDTVVGPIAKELVKQEIPFHGVLFVGLMVTRKGPYVLEFNVRFGDPETQVLMLRLQDDLLPLLRATATGTLKPEMAPKLLDKAAICVVMASDGYPGSYKKDTEIKGLEKAAKVEKGQIFHAGTRWEGDRLLASGGRVLGVSALGRDLETAQARAYQMVDMIDWPGGFCRRDIGWRALKRKAA